jgi:FMN reductase (NADPH)/FMN reductase [NAD(P)H]
MNATLEVIHNRRSLRNFSTAPLVAEEKDAILQATFRAPTAGNMMLYSIIEVEDQALKDRLAETCDNQPFIAKSPFVLLFLADYQRWFDYFVTCEVERKARELDRPTRLPEEGDLLLACCDALIAAQTAVIAAESLGIGSCYIGDILENYEVHRDLFNLPRYTLPVTLLCFGRPASGEMPSGHTPRFASEFIVHRNTYHRFNSVEFEQMYRQQQERLLANPNRPFNAENVGQAMYLRKFIADFSVEMSRSVREMLKNWTVSS